MERVPLEPNGSLETRKMREELSLEIRKYWLHKVTPKKKALIMMRFLLSNQAPRSWYETLSTYLIENGFRRGTIDKTLFIQKDKCDILLVQIPDELYGGTHFFLGLQVQQKEDGIFISQDKYMAEILKKFEFATVKTASTPIET
ncbi:hypothetical protein Tco_0428126, partial [Tanacetum coccineum]